MIFETKEPDSVSDIVLVRVQLLLSEKVQLLRDPNVKFEGTIYREEAESFVSPHGVASWIVDRVQELASLVAEDIERQRALRAKERSAR